nr:MAG TPA: hypothetical protein [Caudoviricetes sp.]
MSIFKLFNFFLLLIFLSNLFFILFLKIWKCYS